MSCVYHVLEIPQGLIRGAKCKSKYGQEYYSFEGIPYGKPPLGNLRFKAPQPAEPWFHVRDCTNFNVKPKQKNPKGEIEGNEDCLYLNVYCSELYKSKPKTPVLVWIYGGSFSFGGATKEAYGPDYFIDQNIILVTFNYRVSALGFLSLEDSNLDVPGNAGLKDQVLALKWVKNNIEYFSGDANNITLFGESSGAASVHFLLCSDAAKNLFHKAICHSGCMLNNWALSSQVPSLAYPLASLKGYTGKNSEESILKYLQDLPADELVDIDQLHEETYVRSNMYAFVPCRETFYTKDGVITKPLWAMLKNAWGNEIPLIIGGVSAEGVVIYPYMDKIKNLMKFAAKNEELLLPKDIPHHKVSIGLLKSRLNELIETHFGNTPLSKDMNPLLLMDYFSYRFYWHALHRTVVLRKQFASAATYQFWFDFDSSLCNYHQKVYCGSKVTKRVAHGDILAYLFYGIYSCKWKKNSLEYKTMRRLVKMWVTFARTGNPNSKSTPKWESVHTAGEMMWLNISDEMKFAEIPHDIQSRFTAWNNLYGNHLILK